ncbi:anti-sigma factor family protein [Allorhodopirellula solitaria]|uniref:Uncharacterized protein n=1 Tax=Allorhodopirellula solitaria TaxID=2527987 RepID=A0A5C5XPR3_9BACT|nr:hypothetical protein [Allorhodopirellula solitaria]TWT65216.1 hypothetical protein CA85_31280 [Allorhodopirellula solitaria]
MNPKYQKLIHGYLDNSLSTEQQSELNQWIKADPKHARQFASSMMLHDRLRSELATSQEEAAPVVAASRLPSRLWRRRSFALASTACVLLLAFSLLWQSVDTPSASAAVVELNRIIEANEHSTDRTFLISVLEAVIPPKHRDPGSPERRRPPKPSLDGAVLDVRGSNQFVLKRMTPRGELFITGSNGETSWAVRPDGPIRYSDDLTRFARDLPGHEDRLPINNLHDGLEALRTAYDLELLPQEAPDRAAGQEHPTDRRMLAVKKPGFLGAARVEIQYAESSGKIREMRFDDMAYGPQRIALTMTATKEQTFPDDYFDHSSHHGQERVVEYE